MGPGGDLGDDPAVAGVQGLLVGEDALIMWAEGLQTPAYAERLAGLAERIPEPREL